ncbi:putative metalloprotease CJM1_0395 family protein [Oceanospirillum sediminis]|uniref:Catalase n=1 Tax=Oceanospirillum sediminis TaxID=2760088 RepID=A0A839IM55_9GAMM|nr:putative metalloprotease CJM1_0395 family protein [Oceanospirillum sediminis]MBB1485602.1 hypothetical protein [Oceanospirillum sediminis]
MDPTTISRSSSYSRLVQDYQQKEKQQQVEPGSDQREARQLEREKQKVISQLSKRDAEVRAHEEAHSNVGGKYASAPEYDLTEGPDGKEYAIGGHVNIDASPVEGNPKATIVKADVVEKAALAPVQPSPQDQKVAGEAREMGNEARVELRVIQTEEAKATRETDKADEAQKAEPVDSDSEDTRASSVGLSGDSTDNTPASEDQNKPKSFAFGLSLPQQFVASVFQQQNPAPSKAQQLQSKFDTLGLSFPPEDPGQQLTTSA